MISPPPILRCRMPLTTLTTSLVVPPLLGAALFAALAGEDLLPKGNNEPWDGGARMSWLREGGRLGIISRSEQVDTS